MPLGDEGAGSGQLLDTRRPHRRGGKWIPVGDVHVPGRIDGERSRRAELARASARAAVRAVAAPLREELAGGRELLHAVGGVVGDVDVAGPPVDASATWGDEVAIAQSTTLRRLPPFERERSGAGELLHARQLEVADVHVPVAIRGDTAGRAKLTLAIPGRAE